MISESADTFFVGQHRQKITKWGLKVDIVNLSCWKSASFGIYRFRHAASQNRISILQGKTYPMKSPMWPIEKAVSFHATLSTLVSSLVFISFFLSRNRQAGGGPVPKWCPSNFNSSTFETANNSAILSCHHVELKQDPHYVSLLYCLSARCHA